MKDWKNYLLEIIMAAIAVFAAISFMFSENYLAATWAGITIMWIVNEIIFKRSAKKYEQIASETIKLNDELLEANERLISRSTEVNNLSIEISNDNVRISECLLAILSDEGTDTSKWSPETKRIIKDWTDKKKVELKL